MNINRKIIRHVINSIRDPKTGRFKEFPEGAIVKVNTGQGFTVVVTKENGKMILKGLEY